MESFLTYKDKRIAYKIRGKGKAIVMLHGFMESMKIWDDMAKDLSKDYQIITLDLPGFGLSDSFDSIHTMEFMTDIVDRLLNFLEIKKCILVGHSMGGYIALSFAEKYAEKLNGLVIFHSQAKADTAEAKNNRERAIEVIASDKGRFILNFIPDLFAPDNVEKHRKKINSLIKHSEKFSKKGIIAAIEGMKNRDDKTHVLKNADVPILFILGKLDPRVPFQDVMKQVAMPKHSELLLLSDVGHMGFIEAESKCLRSIKSFADRIHY
ncbi:alpha/beta fold hydrolase [Bacteroidota bacterium]